MPAKDHEALTLVRLESHEEGLDAVGDRTLGRDDSRVRRPDRASPS